MLIQESTSLSCMYSFINVVLQRLARLALCLFVCFTGLIFSPARAVDVGSYKDPTPALPPPPDANKAPRVQIVRVDFGFDETLVPEQFIPMTVWLTSHASTYSGTLILEFKQDGTQKTNYILPISTTPGKVVPFELVAAFPEQTDEVKLTLQSDSRDVEVVFASRGGRRDEYLPATRNADPFILLIDLPPLVINSLQPANVKVPKPATTEEDAELNDLGQRDLTKQSSLWENVFTSPISIDRLPRSWIAYSNCTIAVIQASSLSRADPQGIEALITWVRSGGRLLVIADSPGSDWTRLFPSDTPLPMTIGEVQKFSPLFLSGLGDVHLLDAPQARPIHLTNAALDSGWKGSWPVKPSISQTPSIKQADQSQDSITSNAWLQAIGPLGLGVVGVLGMDPVSSFKIIDLKKIQDSYLACLDPLIPQHTRAKLEESASTDSNSWGSWVLHSDSLAYDALNRTISLLTPVPVFGVGAFSAIVSVMALLTIVVGLFGGLSRKRIENSMHSWYIALGSILFTCIIAYIVPTFMRSGESLISRVTLLDGEIGPNGSLAGGAVSEVCGVFGGKPGSLRIISEEPGAWWRGVSSLSMNSARNSPFSDLVLPINYAAGTLANAVPVQIDQGQWTYRLTARHVPFDPLITPIVVRAVLTANQTIEVSLSGLPQPTRITTLHARLSDSRELTISPNLISQGKASIQLDLSSMLTLPSADASDQSPQTATQDHSSFDLSDHHLAAGFSVARGRTDALELKLLNPDSILLIITCEGDFTPLSMLPIPPSRSTQTMQLRFVAPLVPYAQGHVGTSSLTPHSPPSSNELK